MTKFSLNSAPFRKISIDIGRFVVLSWKKTLCWRYKITSRQYSTWLEHRVRFHCIWLNEPDILLYLTRTPGNMALFLTEPWSQFVLYLIRTPFDIVLYLTGTRGQIVLYLTETTSSLCIVPSSKDWYWIVILNFNLYFGLLFLPD